jgi:hypothetical protein
MCQSLSILCVRFRQKARFAFYGESKEKSRAVFNEVTKHCQNPAGRSQRKRVFKSEALMSFVRPEEAFLCSTFVFGHGQHSGYQSAISTAMIPVSLTALAKERNQKSNTVFTEMGPPDTLSSTKLGISRIAFLR